MNTSLILMKMIMMIMMTLLEEDMCPHISNKMVELRSDAEGISMILCLVFLFYFFLVGTYIILTCSDFHSLILHVFLLVDGVFFF